MNYTQKHIFLYSCVGVYLKDRKDVVILDNEMGNYFTPSMVAFTSIDGIIEGSQRLIGETARKQVK